MDSLGGGGDTVSNGKRRNRVRAGIWMCMGYLLCPAWDMNSRKAVSFVIMRRATNLEQFKDHVGIHFSLFGF